MITKRGQDTVGVSCRKGALSSTHGALASAKRITQSSRDMMRAPRGRSNHSRQRPESGWPAAASADGTSRSSKESSFHPAAKMHSTTPPQRRAQLPSRLDVWRDNLSEYWCTRNLIGRGTPVAAISPPTASAVGPVPAPIPVDALAVPPVDAGASAGSACGVEGSYNGIASSRFEKVESGRFRFGSPVCPPVCSSSTTVSTNSSACDIAASPETSPNTPTAGIASRRCLLACGPGFREASASPSRGSFQRASASTSRGT
mmetsp:Transcript_19672/g.49995  ORF Transcript_19672/g.49995 Transcript_19672/m.49995 type:complete len:259 (+) Transcript_19672:957-1733(+)